MEQLTSALKKIGVTDVFFCAGARNKELHPLFTPFNIHYNFEERSASFKALGLSKITRRPVVICTTSGSAVLECLPAMAEAFYTSTKLILVTADRSPAHRGTGFAQTLDQITPLQSLCRSQVEQYIDQDFNTEINAFPCHLNFLTEREKRSTVSNCVPDPQKSTLLLFSQGAIELEGDKLYRQLASNTLHYLEPDCGIERTPNHYEILSDEKLCQVLKAGEIEQLIRVGRAPISKCWRNFNDRIYPSIKVFHLDPDDLDRLTFGSKVSHSQLLDYSFPSPSEMSQNQDELQLLFESHPTCELATLKAYTDQIPSNELVFLGNSLTIRNWKIISSRTHFIYSNRGINGIDGSISSAIGIALGTEEKVHCIIGDLTYLYDLGAMIENLPSNLTIVVINNNGGRIFKAITPPFPQIVCEHQYNLTKLSSGFEVKAGQLIELHPCNSETELFRKKWRELHD